MKYLIALAQQRLDNSTNGCHAGGKTDRRYTVFHAGDFVFKRRNGGVTLASITIAGLPALKHGR